MTEQRIIRPNGGHIILPRRFVDVEMPHSRVCASGRYQLIKRDAWGTEIERTPWFDNLILDSGLNHWGTAAVVTGAAIGTGVIAPVVTDTGLQTQSHWTTTTGTGAGVSAGIAPNYNNTRTHVYRTTLGALNGNYTEVGMGWATGAMFSRALILDGGGAPTSIAVTSAQQLDIVYQLSIYPPVVDTGPTVVTISGVDYNVTGRAAGVSSTSNWNVGSYTYPTIVAGNSGVYSGALGAITSSPSGSSSGWGSVVNDAYANNSMTRTATLTAGLAFGNVPGGIMSVLPGWTNFALFQYGFSPVIPKDGTKTLALNFSFGWGRRP